MGYIRSGLFIFLMGLLVSSGLIAQQTNPKADEALQERLNSLQKKGAQVVAPEGKIVNVPPDKNHISQEQSQSSTTSQPLSKESPVNSNGNIAANVSNNADALVNAEILWQEFTDNVVAAEKKYTGKHVAVRGQVSVIRGDDLKATVYLVGRNSLIGAGVIVCVMKTSEVDNAAFLSGGDQIEITGVCCNKGYHGLIEGVEFTDCAVTSLLDKSIKKVETAIIEPVPIQALIKEHQGNEVAARRKYDGKTFTFTGKILKIDRDIMGGSYVFMGGIEEICDVYCYMDSKSEGDLASVQTEQLITLKGVCHSSSGAVFDALKFSDCVMLK